MVGPDAVYVASPYPNRGVLLSCADASRVYEFSMKQGITAALLLVFGLLAAQPLSAHSELEKPLYVATDGIDQGSCQDPATPCRTIGYALERVGKGGEIRVAGGRYEVADVEDVFHLVSGVIAVEGGYTRVDQFRERGIRDTLLVGVPHQYRDVLESRGFDIVADRKGIDAARYEKTETLLALKSSVQSGLAADPCIGGQVGGMACNQVDLLAHLPLANVSARPSRAADVWGFVDLNTGREYVIVGFSNGTGVFDVSDIESPREVGFVDGQVTIWRDVKVVQKFSTTTGRFEAFAYVTTDGAGDGLFVIDLRNLPHAISRVSYGSDFSAAHNVYAANTDFATGLAITGNASSLIIAGSDNGGGRLRSYSLANGLAPELLDMPGNASYMHDASSMIIYDARKDTQCVNGGDYCEVLFDFSEDRVDIWDITMPAAPALLGFANYANTGYTHSGWPSEDKQYLFVHDELDEQGFGLQTTVRTMSLSNLASPVVVNTWSGLQRAIDHNGFARGNRYYMSNYTRGLTILDITDATSPVAIGHFDTSVFNDNSASFAGAWGAYPFLPSGAVAVSDIEEGLYLLADRTLDGPQGTISFTESSYGVDEGQSVTLELQRGGSSSGNVGVGFEIIAASGDTADVAGIIASPVWSDGDDLVKGIGISFSNDGMAEGLQQFVVRLVAPTGGATLSGTTVANVFVSDPGATPVVDFDRNEIFTAERGFATAVAVLRRSGSAIGAVSVDYSISGGDASAGSDFTGSTDGTISWADGDGEPKWIEFAVVDDGAGEPDEYFELTLSNAVGAAVGSQASLRVNIADGSGNNQVPNAVAGASQTVEPGALVTLDGNQSNDPDGDALTYLWTQTAGAAVTLNGADTSIATFTAPSVTSSTMLRFQLAVTDPRGLTDVATTNVTVSTSTGIGGDSSGGGGTSWLAILALSLLSLVRGSGFSRGPR